jgi:VCBS repeat protein
VRRIAIVVAFLVWPAVASAGGFLVFDGGGAPVGWDPAVPLHYMTDRGALGALSQTQAEALVDTLFAPWADIPTSTITYERAGTLDVDVTEANFGPFLGPFGGATSPLGKTAVVFDANGEIFAELFGQGTGIVGFADVTWASAGGPPLSTDAPLPPGAKIVEGLVFLNGEFIDGAQEPGNPELPRPQFDAAIVHELGHLSGLGHTQVHGLQFPPETDLPGWTAPVETMFPQVHPLGGQGTPERDDVVALSRLYPANGFFASTGCVAGRVLTSTGELFTGANVVAWNLDDAADALSWVSGAALVDAGAYTLCGLRPGARYRIDVQEIDVEFAGGSRVGPFSIPAILPGPPESWSGTNESSDPALDPAASFEPVQVAAGTTRSGVDLRLNRQAFAVLNSAWPLDETPVDFAVGDFDGDGHQDFVGVQFGFDPGNLVSFSRGRGDGTFEPPVVVDDFPGNESVVAGQLNTAVDAHLDVAVVSGSTGEVRVYFGDGHGGFAPPQTVVAGQGFFGFSSKLAIGDLNGDAFTDIARFTRHGDASATVYTLLGGGSGAFTVVPTEVPPHPDVEPRLGELLLGQFAGSPANDLLTIGASGSGGGPPVLQLFNGDGAGHFTAATVPLGGITRRIYALGAGDLDGDGRLDLALSDLEPVGLPISFIRSWITLLRGDGSGGFALAHRYRVPETVQQGIVIADFNRDSRPDVASAGSFFQSPGAKIHLGLGDGAGGVREVISVWGLAEFPAFGGPAEMATGDFDGDGKLDLLLGDGSSTFPVPAFVPRVSILLQRELGGEIGPCVASDERLCLAGGRFRVEANWTADVGDGRGHAVPLTADTGYFWFFVPTNLEAIVKVLDACAFSQRFWVFASGLTDVGVAVRVTDSVTGAERIYTNPRGVPFQPRQDTSAFATCP